MLREIPEPQLTRIIQEMDTRGEDPVAQIEVIDGTARWRGGFGPTMSERDQHIISLDVGGWDFAQVVLSRIVGRNNGEERETLKSRHLPIEDVKQYLRGDHER